jgi:SAM-dependent methyltransferase
MRQIETSPAAELSPIKNREMPQQLSRQQEMLQYYESGQEAGPLESPLSRWEKIRTLDLLKRFLPSAPAVILDVGGGAGAYAFTLAENGYIEGLTDPVPLHIDQARKLAASRRLVPRTFQVGDARAIPCDAGTADAVLLFGPLYHLTNPRERLNALRELQRVWNSRKIRTQQSSFARSPR